MKKKVAKKHTAKKGITIAKLEQPVHNIVGYGVLLVLSVVTLFIVLNWS